MIIQHITTSVKSVASLAVENTHEWDFTTGGSTETDVWTFQIAENLTMGSDVKIILSGDAKASNIFWQVAGQATLGTTSHFEGTILSMTGITFQTGASINGKALAQTAVVLDGNAVTQ